MKGRHIKHNTIVLFFIFCLILLVLPVKAKPIPELLLAKTYDKGIDIADYLVSEKLDGVRAYWDGKQLLSRQGNRFNAPEWFVKDFPVQVLDGELWIGRGKFEKTMSIVSKTIPIDSEWKQISYQLFELPNTKGTFQQRVLAMEQIVKTLALPHLNLIKQYRLENTSALMNQLDAVIAQGAEGLMLHYADALYQTGRSKVLLKVKKHQDAEAQVIQHLKGKGKFADVLGSMVVEDETGLRFKIGTGFSLKQRKYPPAIGATITYKYFGRTKRGVPRFASFLRVREIFDSVL